jgi:hypothetical protein
LRLDDLVEAGVDAGGGDVGACAARVAEGADECGVVFLLQSHKTCQYTVQGMRGYRAGRQT